MQVPETSVTVASLTLLDTSGATVLEVAVPPEQQTRFKSDTQGNPSGLLNRVWVDLAQSTAPDGDLSAVTHVALRRAGLTGLDNFSPGARAALLWRVTSLRVRRGCKGACA